MCPGNFLTLLKRSTADLEVLSDPPTVSNPHTAASLPFPTQGAGLLMLTLLEEMTLMPQAQRSRQQTGLALCLRHMPLKEILTKEP